MKPILIVLLIAVQFQSIGQSIENPFIKQNGLEDYSLSYQGYLQNGPYEDPLFFTNPTKYDYLKKTSLDLALPVPNIPAPSQEFGYAVLKLGMSLITSGRVNFDYDNSRYRYTPPMYKD